MQCFEIIYKDNGFFNMLEKILIAGQTEKENYKPRRYSKWQVRAVFDE